MSAKDRSATTVGAMAHRHYPIWVLGTAATEYDVGKTLDRAEDVLVFVDGAIRRPDDAAGAHDYKVRGFTNGYPGDKNRVKFAVAPNGKNVCFYVVGG